MKQEMILCQSDVVGLEYRLLYFLAIVMYVYHTMLGDVQKKWVLLAPKSQSKQISSDENELQCVELCTL